MVTEFWPWGIARSGASIDSFLGPLASLGFSASVLEKAVPIEYARLAILVPVEKERFVDLVFKRGMRVAATSVYGNRPPRTLAAEYK